MSSRVTSSATYANINGVRVALGDDRGRTLLAFLRSDLGLTGAKPGCGEGECGACTVLVDGAPTLACRAKLADVAERTVTTIEGLSSPGELHAVQGALVEARALQCGYCAPGMALRAAALLAEDPAPDDDEIAGALEPNLCRCGCYHRILHAVHLAAGPVPDNGGWASAGVLPIAGPSTSAFRPRRPWNLTPVDERDWFELLGDGLVVVWPARTPPTGMWPADGGAWVHVAPTGVVTAFTGKVDVGQDNLTAFTALVAEELAVDIEAVRVVQGDTDLCPFDPGTFGSRSMPDAGEALRRAAAGARRALADLMARSGGTVDAVLSGRRLVEVLTSEPQLTERSEDHLNTTKVAAARLVGAVTGERRYVSDLERPGMLFGAVLRPPVDGAELVEVDLGPLAGESSVRLLHDGGLVCAVADDLRSARAALATVRAKWTDPPTGPSDLIAYLRTHEAEGTGWDRAVDESAGDVDGALAHAATRCEATYTTAYLAHVPLETTAAVAEWEDARLTVWVGTQVPFGTRRAVAAALDLDEADVRVVVPPTGGGFGGKHGAQVAVEAAMLARAVGHPVQVHWSRREEFDSGYLRPMAVIDTRGAVDRDGRLVAIDLLDINAGAAGLELPYAVANRRLQYRPAQSPLRQGSYRALAATANTFARESLIDELAAAIGADPLGFRLANIDDERLAAVVRAAGNRFDWPSHHDSPVRGSGCALGLEKGGRVATCAEVAVDEERRISVTRIVTAYECGRVVSRDTVLNQIEGATMMALGGALFEEVTVEDGRLVAPTLSGYRVPRFSDLPAIEVVLLDRPDLPSAGAGETPMIAVAPAIANAIFAATGRRLRSLPLVPTGAVV